MKKTRVRAEIVVLDTHAWVWWISSPEQLSLQAKKRIDEASETSSIYISSISVWEVVMLVTRGRLELTIVLLTKDRKIRTYSGVPSFW